MIKHDDPWTLFVHKLCIGLFLFLQHKHWNVREIHVQCMAQVQRNIVRGYWSLYRVCIQKLAHRYQNHIQWHPQFCNPFHWFQHEQPWCFIKKYFDYINSFIWWFKFTCESQTEGLDQVALLQEREHRPSFVRQLCEL